MNFFLMTKDYVFSVCTVDLMHDYMKANGYELDITDTRYHHEIYLSDPRKCDVSRLKTVVRHPIRKAE